MMTSREKYMLLLVSLVQVVKRWNAATYCRTRTCGRTLAVSKVSIFSASSSGKVACHSSKRSSVRWPKA
jgi:hypothetical protein